MLLKRYVVDVFDPTPGEIAPIADTVLVSVMKRTWFARLLVRLHTCLTANVRYVAAVSVLFALCGVFIANQDGHKDSAESDTQLAPALRGGAAVSIVTESKEDHPLAYLVDIHGEIVVLRNGKKHEVRSSCELLNQGDELDFSENAKGKIMYEDALYSVSGPVRYRITLPDPLRINSSGNSNVVEPQFTTRGAHLGLGKPEVFIVPPAAMLAQVIPPTTRAGDVAVQVFSPRGACYGKYPSLGITGDSNSVYEVSVTDMDNNLVVQGVKVRGGATVDGTAVFAAALEADEIYTVRVKLNGKMVNEVSASTFWLVGDNERAKMEIALNHISSLASASTKDFFTANVLYSNGCHSEAYLLARKLHDKEKENDIYTNLLKLCSGALGFR